MSSTPCSAQSAHQTTTVFHDRPEKIRIIHPPHPLFGQTLEVICPRREAEETFWIAQLKDGSGISLPSSWTDHPLEKRPVQRIRAGTRATPSALRGLADLLEVLVSGSPVFHNRSRDSVVGGHDERATSSFRMESGGLGRKRLESSWSPQTPRDSFDPGRDGTDFFKSEKGRDDNQGEVS